jgi:hypothetical protein
MRKSSKFSSVLEATDRLTLEEKETLLEVLHRRTVQGRRDQLKREIDQDRHEHGSGKSQPAT